MRECLYLIGFISDLFKPQMLKECTMRARLREGTAQKG